MEQQSAYSLLADKMGEGPTRADIAIGACAADENLAAPLNVNAGDALLVMRRVSHFASGVCCYHTHLYVRPERY